MGIICTTSVNILNDAFPAKSCGDNGVEVFSKLSTPLSEVNTVEEFERNIYSELIDVKNRQSITAYPILRLIYERYLDNNL